MAPDRGVVLPLFDDLRVPAGTWSAGPSALLGDDDLVVELDRRLLHRGRSRRPTLGGRFCRPLIAPFRAEKVLRSHDHALQADATYPGPARAEDARPFKQAPQGGRRVVADAGVASQAACEPWPTVRPVPDLHVQMDGQEVDLLVRPCGGHGAQMRRVTR